MPRYIDADALIKKIFPYDVVDKKCYTINTKTIYEEIQKAPTADVASKSEVAEMLRLTFNDDCACNYNGNDEWLPCKCKYAETECPTPKERLGCWKEFVEHKLAELEKKYIGEQNK